MEQLKENDLITSYWKDSAMMGGTYHQTKLTPLGKELYAKSKLVKTLLYGMSEIRETIFEKWVIKWQMIEAVGAGCTDLEDTYEVEIEERSTIVPPVMKSFWNTILNYFK